MDTTHPVWRLRGHKHNWTSQSQEYLRLPTACLQHKAIPTLLLRTDSGRLEPSGGEHRRSRLCQCIYISAEQVNNACSLSILIQWQQKSFSQFLKMIVVATQCDFNKHGRLKWKWRPYIRTTNFALSLFRHAYSHWLAPVMYKPRSRSTSHSLLYMMVHVPPPTWLLTDAPFQPPPPPFSTPPHFNLPILSSLSVFW